MNFGLAMFPTTETRTPAEFARGAEERGFESVFFPEHSHIPASRDTPYPMGGELPREYAETLDPFACCTSAAAATERLRVGTGLCVVVQRDPIHTAKSVATVDLLSGGRFLFGVGAGWNEEEMQNHGTDPARRFKRMRESVEAMQQIWTQDEASYDGELVSFERIWCWPKPVQKPYPPVLIGGNAKGAPDRVVRYGDEWIPNRIGDDDKIIARIEKLVARSDEAGRPLSVTLQLAPREPELIERYEQAGVGRCVYYLPHGDHDKVEHMLDKYTAAKDEYEGR